MPNFTNPDNDPHKTDLTILNQFLDWCLDNADISATIKSETLKVINCLKFIKCNIKNISEFVNNPVLWESLSKRDKRLRVLRDHDGTSLHFGTYNNPENAVRELSNLIHQFENSISEMTRLDQLKGFAEAIRYDRANGCVEARTTGALLFANEIISLIEVHEPNDTFILILDQLFKVIFEKFTENSSENYSLVYQYFIDHGYMQKPCLYTAKNGESMKGEITTDLIDDYMSRVLGQVKIDKTGKQEEDLQASQQYNTTDKTVFFDQHSPQQVFSFNDWHYFCFASQKEAAVYLKAIKYLIASAPAIDKAHIIKTARYPETPYRFQLSNEQFTALNLAYSKSKKWQALDTCLIKNIRGDTENYFSSFKLLVTRSEKQQIRIPLRKGAKQPYTVKATGVEERSTRKPQYIAKQKQSFSQPQSTTLVFPEHLSPLFQFNSDKTNQQVAFIFDLKDALINRMFIYDGGTISRPYDGATFEAAAYYYEAKVTGKNPILFGDLEAFKKAILDKINKDKHNEVLARLRWNTDGSSMIAISNKAIEARWLAWANANSLSKRLQDRSFEEGYAANTMDNYQIPICFYMPGEALHQQFYTLFDQLEDKHQALSIYKDPQKKLEAYQKNTYEFLLVLDPEQISNALSETIKGIPLLFAIIQNGYVHIAELLLERIGNEFFNKLIKENKTHFYTKMAYELARAGATHLITALLDNNCPVDWSCGQDSPLVIANTREQFNIIKSVFEKDSNASTANFLELFHAISKNELLAVKQLLSNNCYPNWRDIASGDYCIHRAIENNNKEIVMALLQVKTDLTVHNKNNLTPIQLAYSLNYFDLVEAIAKERPVIDITLYTRYGLVLISAIKDGQTQTALTLVAAGAALRSIITPAEWNTFAHLAVQFRNSEILEAIIRIKADYLTCKNKAGLTPIELACKLGHWDLVEHIARKKHPVTSENPIDFVPIFTGILSLALSAGQTPAALALINSYEKIALEHFVHLAIQTNNKEVLAALLKKEVSMSLTNEAGLTPIELACELGHWHLVELIANHNCIRYLNDRYEVALVNASSADKTQVVNALLKAGKIYNFKTNPNEKHGPTGNYAVHFAILNKNSEMLKILLEENVDLTVKNPAGQTPLELALESDDWDMIKIMVTKIFQDNTIAKKKAEYPTLLKDFYQHNHNEKSLVTLAFAAKQWDLVSMFTVQSKDDLIIGKDIRYIAVENRIYIEQGKTHHILIDTLNAIFAIRSKYMGSPTRTALLKDLERFALAKYSELQNGRFIADDILPDVVDKLKTLTEAVKADHNSNGLIASRFSLFSMTKSRLASHLEQCLNVALNSKEHRLEIH